MQKSIQPLIRILTNHPGQESSPTWKSVTTHFRHQGNTLLSDSKLALRLYANRLRHDCVVLGAGRSDILFALLQSLLPFRKAPTIFIDCLWSRHPKGLWHALKKLIFRIAERSVDRFVVWAEHEKEVFPEVFALARNKFVAIPYHTTLEASVSGCGREGYIFSGGNSDRDYATLIEAVRDLPVQVVIASTLPRDHFPDPLPDNILIRGFSEEDFFREMAGCSMNIVALAKGKLRSAGQQTFLNSMFLGKPTIVTDMAGPIGYIEHGRDGLLVPPQDPGKLRAAIEMLLNNPLWAQEMGRRAAQKARIFSTEEHFRKIVQLAVSIVNAKGSCMRRTGARAPKGPGRKKSPRNAALWQSGYGLPRYPKLSLPGGRKLD